MTFSLPVVWVFGLCSPGVYSEPTRYALDQTDLCAGWDSMMTIWEETLNTGCH
jgi:hypothetical protein